MCQAVVGIRVDIKDIQIQFKLSQNKTSENRVEIVIGLKELHTAKADGMGMLVRINFGYKCIDEQYYI